MIIHYASSKMKKTLENERLMKKKYSSNFERLRNRLTEIKYADSLADIPEVPPPRRHKLTGSYANCWGINFSKNDRIIITPVGDFDIEELNTIVEVKILKLEDYH